MDVGISSEEKTSENLGPSSRFSYRPCIHSGSCTLGSQETSHHGNPLTSQLLLAWGTSKFGHVFNFSSWHSHLKVVVWQKEFCLLVFALKTHASALPLELSQMPTGMFLIFALQSVRQVFFFFFSLNKDMIFI